jgi:hypothetical protein
VTLEEEVLISSSSKSSVRNSLIFAADSSVRRCRVPRSSAVTVKVIGQITRLAATSRSARPLTVT